MPATLEQSTSETAKPRSVFILRFISTIVLWSIALFIAFTGYEILFWLLISAFGLIALLEFYRMLDHRGLPNFKIIGLICGAIMLAGSFHYFSTIGPASSYDFEVAGVVFFFFSGVCPAKVAPVAAGATPPKHASYLFRFAFSRPGFYF